jgi:hypothetical protein
MIKNKILECVFMNHYDDNSCSVSQLADTKSLSHSKSMECTGLSLLFVHGQMPSELFVLLFVHCRLTLVFHIKFLLHSCSTKFN